MRVLIAAGLLFPIMASAAEVKTGGARMVAVDGKYNVWTDRAGRGHLEMYDDQETYFRELVRFVKDVEAGKFAPATPAAH